jgi:endonuclease YncB( thermonuclease family)
LWGKVLLSGLGLGLDRLEAGPAGHDRRFQDGQTPKESEAYAKAEQDAGEARRGLWADPEPVPPWVGIPR